MIAGRDHGNLVDAALAARINREMHAAVQPVFSSPTATRD